MKVSARGNFSDIGPKAVAVASPEETREPLAEEDRLLRDAQKGDRAAFASLVSSYWDRLYRWLYHLTRDRHTAEDLTQDTFLKAFAHLNRFQAGTNFAAWLFRIGHNNFANHYRSHARQRETLPDDLPSPGANPVEEASHRELVQGVERAIQRLAPEFRAALVLRIEEGLSFRQIAEILDVTEETARWRVFKARQKLLSQVCPALEQELS